MPFIEPIRPIRKHECWLPWWTWLLRRGTRYQCGCGKIYHYKMYGGRKWTLEQERY